MEEQEEIQLVQRMMSDDRDAFECLMKHYYPKTLRMAYLISGNYADSEDIVQETFVLCYVNRKKIKEPEHFERWLYKTLTRESWRICRLRKREQPVDEVFGEDTPGSSSVLEEVINAARDRELYGAIEKLPAKQRTVIVLYYFNQLSSREIAKVMGCMEGTVKSRLFTARKNLKRVLADEHYTMKKEVFL